MLKNCAMDYYTRMNDPVQAAQAELEILSMLQAMGKEVDENRVKELKDITGGAD